MKKVLNHTILYKKLFFILILLFSSNGITASSNYNSFKNECTVSLFLIDYYSHKSISSIEELDSYLAPPATPGPITGLATQCPNITGQIYSIVAVSGATSYSWTVPTGWVIESGNGTTSITVSTGNTGQNGTISVRSVDGSGSSAARNLAVTVGQPKPATPGVISGSSTQCPNLVSQTYSVATVTNATSYSWTVPTGWTITAGATTRTITVTTGNTGDNGFITVSAINNCGSSNSQSLSTTVNPAKPLPPNALSGTVTACTSFTANWESSLDATSYRLDVSTVNTFTSFVTGYNNLAIGNVTTADVSGLLAGRNYYYRVRAVNSCGTSISSNVIAITTLPATPSTPLAITGSATQCPGATNRVYSTATVANATFYTWTVPTGWAITAGLGTNTIEVTAGVFGQNGTITVAAANSCGTSANRTLAVSVLVGKPSTPTANAGTTAACTSFRANWSVVSGATTYYLDVATDIGFTSFVSGYNNRNVGNVLNTTVSGLQPGITYYYRVLAASTCDVSAYSNTISYTTLPLPNNPVATTATAIGCTTSTLNWNVVTGATSYRLDIATDVSFTNFVPSYNNANVGNVILRAVTGLTAGTTYYYRVLAVNTCGNSGYSNTVTFSTNPKPIAPVANAGTAVSCSGITANWSAVIGATSYRLDVSTASDFSSFVSGYNNRNVGNVVLFNITSLAYATTYYYRVLAVNACGSGAYSNTITFTTNAAPAAPVEKPGSNAACTSFRANWNSVVGATNYRLDVSEASDFSSFVSGYNNRSVGNVVLANVTGLVAGKTYYYRVLATHPCGNSGYSGTVTYSTLPLPIAPISNNGSAATCTGFTANWAAVTGANSYRLDVATDAAFTLFVSGYNNRNVGNVVATAVTGLSPNTTYFYRVAAANTCGSGAYSSTITYATLPLPVAPIANTPTSTSCTEASVSWSAVSGASSYSLDVSVTNDFSSFVPGYNNLNVGNTLTRNLTGLIAGTTYYYRVLASNSCGNSSYSPTITFTTSPLPPSPNINPVTAIACTSATLNWTTVSGTTNYAVDVSIDSGFTTFVSGYNNLLVGNLTTLNVIGLTAGVTYYYRILSINSCGNSSYSSTYDFQTLPVPAIPIASAGSANSCTTFDANWSPSIGADIYFLDVATDAAFSSFVPGYNNLNVGNTSILTVSGLTAGTQYYYRVLANNSCGNSSYSSIITTETLSAPAAPVLNIDTTTCTTINASWTAVATTTSYYLDVSTQSDFSSFVSGYNNKNLGNVTSFIITGLNPGATYYYRILASNACGESNYSSTTSTNTLPTVLTPIATSFTDTGVPNNCTSFIANWDATPNATTYFLDVATDVDFTAFVPGYNNKDVSNVNSYLVTGLVVERTYFYRVRASNSCTTSSSSNTITASTALSTVLAPAVAYASTGETCTTITANWEIYPGATNYILDVSTLNDFSSYVLGFDKLIVGDVQSYVITGLTAGTTYYYRVRASNECGKSNSSNTITCTTSPAVVFDPGTVTNLPDSSTCSSITINWSLVAGATTYFIDIATDNGFTTPLAGYVNFNVGNVQSLTINSLPEGTNYFYRIRASNGCGTSGDIFTGTITTLISPSVPVNLIVSNQNCTTATVSWDIAPNATSYFIDVSKNNTFTSYVSGFNNKDLGSITTANISGLTAGTTYYYRVLSSNSCGESAYSAIITFDTLPLPIPPLATSGSNSTCASFTANWGAVVGAISYRIDVATDNTFTDYVLGYNNLNVSNVTSLIINGLAADKTYYYRVLAVNTCGDSSYSSIITHKTLPLPATPIATAGTNIDCDIFTANWELSLNATSYYLDVATDSGFTSFVLGYNNKKITALNDSVTGLIPGTTYYYRVLASNDCGESVYSTTISITTTPLPDIPVIKSGTNALCTEFTANWEAVPGALSYRIDVATDSGFTDYVLNYNNADTGNKTSIVVTGLKPNTIYYYRVLAINKCWSNNYSGTASYSTAPLPGVPISNAGSNPTCTGFTANWSSATDALVYYIDVAKDASFTDFVQGYNNLDVLGVTSKEIIGLTPGTTYYYRVLSSNVCGESVYSSIQTVDTLPVPIAPIANAGTEIDCTSFNANWELSNGADSYAIDVATDVNFTNFLLGYNNLELGNVSTTIISGLKPGVTYYYRVLSSNDCGESVYSNIITYKNREVLPAPIVANGTLAVCDGFTANWNGVNGATHYSIDVANDMAFTDIIFEYNYKNVGNVTSFKVVGLQTGKTYYYRVLATNDCGDSNYSAIMSVDTQKVPPVPVAKQGTNATCFSFTANWELVSGAQNYLIDVATDVNFTNYVLGYNNVDAGTGNSLLINGLIPGITYYYRLLAINECWTNEYSETITVTTLPVPVAPIANGASNISSTGGVVKWSSVQNAISYSIDLATDSNFTTFVLGYNNLNVANVNEFVFTGLQPETVYYCRVLATNQCGESLYSNTISFITSATVLAVVKANDDIAPDAINGVVGEKGVLNVFDNDTYNSIAVLPSQVILKVTSKNDYLVLNPDGSIDVLPNSVSGLQSLIYEICDVMSPSNCSQAVVNVTIDIPVQEVMVVNKGVSPNNDGIGDVFIVDGIQNFPENTVKIFNRYGVLVFERKGYDNENVVFNGRSNVGTDIELSEDTYFYVIQYKNKEGNTIGFSSYLYLKR